MRQNVALASMSFKLIRCQHRHCVFTIPEELRHFFLEDRSLLNCLFSAVRSVVLRMFYKINKSEKEDERLHRAISRQQKPVYLDMITWRNNILFSFGYDPVKCPCCDKKIHRKSTLWNLLLQDGF